MCDATGDDSSTAAGTKKLHLAPIKLHLAPIESSAVNYYGVKNHFGLSNLIYNSKMVVCLRVRLGFSLKETTPQKPDPRDPGQTFQLNLFLRLNQDRFIAN